MHRSPLIKAHPNSPHLSKQQTRVPTAPLKSRPKGSALISDSLGIERDIIHNFAEKIKEHPLKDYSIAKEKPKVEVVTLPKTNLKQPYRPTTNEGYDELLEQKRPQTSKGTRRSKQTDSQYHEEEPEDLVMFSQELTTEASKDRDTRKKPTTRIIFSAHTKRPKVVHLDELITKNIGPTKKRDINLPFETSIDHEFLSLFANKR